MSWIQRSYKSIASREGVVYKALHIGRESPNEDISKVCKPAFAGCFALGTLALCRWFAQSPQLQICVERILPRRQLSADGMNQ